MTATELAPDSITAAAFDSVIPPMATKGMLPIASRTARSPSETDHRIRVGFCAGWEDRTDSDVIHRKTAAANAWRRCESSNQ